MFTIIKVREKVGKLKRKFHLNMKANYGLTPVKPEDRNPDNGCLLSETQERILDELERCVSKGQYLTVNQVAEQLQVKWETARKLIIELNRQMSEDGISPIIFQIKFYEHQSWQLDNDPCSFGVCDKNGQLNKVRLFRLKSEIFTKINAARKLMQPNPNAEDTEFVPNIDLWANIKPKTLEKLRIQDSDEESQ